MKLCSVFYECACTCVHGIFHYGVQGAMEDEIVWRTFHLFNLTELAVACIEELWPGFSHVCPGRHFWRI